MTLSQEIYVICKRFYHANYPPTFVDSTVARFLNEKYTNGLREPKIKHKPYVCVPYLGSRMHDFVNTLKLGLVNKGLNPAFYHRLIKLKNRLRPKKTRSDHMNCNNVVYGYFCAADEKCLYIGMTERVLRVRCKEHTKPPSPIYLHIMECNKCADTCLNDRFRILDHGNNKCELLVKEALKIKHFSPNLNTQDDSIKLLI